MVDRSRIGQPVHIGAVLQKMLREAPASAEPPEVPEAHRAAMASRRRTIPLTENGFTPIPRALDDLVVRLARRRDGRTLARTLMAVLMDLARYTDNVHGDVIVTNNGIMERRGVSLSSVKATIKLLLELHVLQKTEPAGERLFQLRQVPGGFSGKRRYLVWNPQSKWRLSDSDESTTTVIALWNDYSSKANAAEMRDQGKGSPRSPIAAGEEVFVETSF